MNVLMSHSTPLVRKRQVMRMSFGDYRAKMAEEDKKLSKGTFVVYFEKMLYCFHFSQYENKITRSQTEQ